MNIDYSQFYVGTSSIKSYGDSAQKKDTLVKYEFRTTDEHGNKIMDKMTREETLQAMKDISSQYGDNVIVEFSGDGMAALVENRKGLADEAVTDEQRAAMAERDAAFANEVIQNEHREAAPEHIASRIDYNKIMHDKSPEVAEKMDGYLREFSKTQDMSYLHKAAKVSLDWYKESYRKHPDWFEDKNSVNSSAVSASVSTSVNSKHKLSSKAQKLLKELSSKYGNIDFMVGNSRNARELMKNSGKEYTVLFTEEELEKMASDDSYKEEMLNKANRLMDFSNRINEKFGFTAMGGNASGGIVSKYGLAVDGDGKVTFFAELTNKTKEEKAWLHASSEDELFGMIKQYDWSKAAEERKIVFSDKM